MSGIAPASLELGEAWRSPGTSYVSCLEPSPDNSLVVVTCADEPASILSIEGKRLISLGEGTIGAPSVSWHPDGSRFGVACPDGSAQVWRADGSLLYELDAGGTWTERIAYSPSGSLLATANGRNVRLWEGERLVRDFKAHESTVTDIGWKPARAGGRSETIASICYGGLRMWQEQYEGPTRTFEWKGSSLVLGWSPNGQYIATGDQDSSVHFWIVKNGVDLQMCGYATKVKELAWDDTSRYLATGGGSIVTVWDCSGKGPEGTRPVELEMHEDKVNALEFSPSSSLLASGGEDGMVCVWSLDQADRPVATGHSSSAICAVRWVDESRGVLVGTASGDIVMFAL
ncbi:MAG TPA: WD40 repeat domain-containing protein [Verrucomicrobiae bacterium]|nr:WD40 repeat domain-containing protein [Verrucomicrobiae bacterium]